MIPRDDYRFLQDFLRREMGNELAPDRDDLVVNRLRPVAASYGLEEVAELLKQLRNGHDRTLREAVIEAMATHETYFFRSTRLFDSLRSNVIPSLIAARSASRQLHIWCAGCSTGQEPYSVAMTLSDRFPQLAEWQLRILATDISESALQRGRAGSFTQFEVQRGLPVQFLLRYFKKIDDRWQIAESLQRVVSFRRFNLLDNFNTLDGPFDIIFVRNVLIYFDNSAKSAIFDKLHAQIAHDGYLALGESETIIGLTNQFRIPKTDFDYYVPA